jgi:hypothetical protein
MHVIDLCSTDIWLAIIKLDDGIKKILIFNLSDFVNNGPKKVIIFFLSQ